MKKEKLNDDIEGMLYSKKQCIDMAYNHGWRMGFYFGIFVMGLFSIFVLVMTFLWEKL